MALPGRVLERTPAPALFLVSGFGQYYGVALAVGLFAAAPAVSVAWARIAVAAVLLVLWRRPWRIRWTRREWLASAGFGCILATMNVSFYLSIAYLPMGPAVAIEFIGPIAVAAATGRGRRQRLGVVLAAAGVLLLAGTQVQQGWTPQAVLGLAAVLIAGICWAAYILLGRHIALRRDGMTSLAVGMAAGGLVFAPFLAGPALPLFSEWSLFGLILLVAVLGSVVPYATEQFILRRVPAAQFAILTALLPVAATLNGALVLGQVPTVEEVVGIVAVCAAIALSVPKDPAEAPVN